MEHLLDPPGVYLLMICIAVVSLFCGWLIGYLNQNKTLTDYDNGLVVEMRQLPSLYPKTKPTITALTTIGEDIKDPSVYLLNIYEAQNGRYSVPEDQVVKIEFLRKTTSGWEPGILNEQLAQILLDRAEKDYESAPYIAHERQKLAIREYLEACKIIQDSLPG